MIGIVPVAGKSSRFKKAGYKTSKIFLPLRDGRPMLQHVIESLGLPDGSDLYLIGDGTDQDVFNNLVPTLAKMKLRGIKWTVIWSEGMVDPLDTLMRSFDSLENSDDRLLINYADVFLTDGAQTLVRHIDGGDNKCGMTFFRSDDPRFQKTIALGAVRGGTFYFRHARELVSGYLNLTRVPEREYGPADIIEKRADSAYLECVLGANLIDLGTPQDYEAYMKGSE